MDVPIGHSIGSDAHQLLFSSYIPVNNKLAFKIFINNIESSKSMGIDRLKEWPENVLCDTNFGNNVPSPSEKVSTYYAGGALYYLFEENILAKMYITTRNNESYWNVSINYSYK